MRLKSISVVQVSEGGYKTMAEYIEPYYFHEDNGVISP